MASRLPVRRSVLPLFLALVMAAGSAVATSALGPGPSRPAATPNSPASAIAHGFWTTPAARGVPSRATKPGFRWTVRPAPLQAAAPKAAPKPAPKPKAKPKPAPARVTPRPAKPRATTPVYKGRNHFWMPALGINRSVGWYYCGNPRAPGLGVYRWGCAGNNNTYLLAHAYASFRSLHDAYVRGRLRKGMKAMYADASGRVRTYAIVWWRLTAPDNGAFAYAAQSRPSMTLQTCVGSRSQYRLIVRLVAVS